MKEKYIKPALVMERFDLAQSIAADCGAAHSSTVGSANHWGKSTCGWDVGNDVIWVTTPSPCTEWWPEDAPYEGICYNNPDGGNNIFSS